MTFNPFENRMSRNIRNALGEAFLNAVKTGDSKNFQDCLRRFKTKDLNPETRTYIDSREEKLKILFRQLPDNTDFFETFKLFWGNRLYFEAHEWVEKRWLTARGDEKKWLQAVIRACVAFEQLEYHRTGPAGKLAQKALTVLEQYSPNTPDTKINQTLIRDLKTTRN